MILYSTMVWKIIDIVDKRINMQGQTYKNRLLHYFSLPLPGSIRAVPGLPLQIVPRAMYHNYILLRPEKQQHLQ